MTSWEPDRPPKGTLAGAMAEFREALAELGLVTRSTLPQTDRVTFKRSTYAHVIFVMLCLGAAGFLLLYGQGF